MFWWFLTDHWTLTTGHFSLWVIVAKGFHPFPFRTRKLSPPAPMVLHARVCGRVGRCPIKTKAPAPPCESTGVFYFFLCNENSSGYIIDVETVAMKPNPNSWHASCIYTEPSMHQLAPYIGKLKSTIAKSLVCSYTDVGDTIFDPFSGCGTVPLEAALAGRNVIAADCSAYAVLLTRAKLDAPVSLESALHRLETYSDALPKAISGRVGIPLWVRRFFHPRTLQEIIAFRNIFTENQEYFLLACLLGILHHQRPGFLSYPASHLVPYLRNRKYPRHLYPDMYRYRAVAPRLAAKIRRSYRRFTARPSGICARCVQTDVRAVSVQGGSVDAVITSPPYMNALDYYRDNRLRLWFLGVPDTSVADGTMSPRRFVDLMRSGLMIMRRSLKLGGVCALVVGEVGRSGVVVDTPALVANVIGQVGGFRLVERFQDAIPDIRRARRQCRATKRESILVYRRVF